MDRWIAASSHEFEVHNFKASLISQHHVFSDLEGPLKVRARESGPFFRIDVRNLPLVGRRTARPATVDRKHCSLSWRDADVSYRDGHRAASLV